MYSFLSIHEYSRILEGYGAAFMASLAQFALGHLTDFHPCRAEMRYNQARKTIYKGKFRSMSHVYSIDQDLREAEAMVKGFERYLRGSEIYGSVTGGFFNFGDMPSLTVGALEMRLRRLQALSEQMTTDQQARLHSALKEYEVVRKEWRAHYEKKVLREAHSRLNTIQQYFQDIAQGTDAAGAYGPEQFRRTIVQELLDIIEGSGIPSGDLRNKVAFVDHRLDAIAVEYGGFSWDPILEPIYPQTTYWWLYRQPRGVR